ncbi:MAG: hypothetical protein AB8B66_03020 [Rickettsiaceae bacterium]
MIGWLRNGVMALAIAGLYSIVLVMLRTPQLSGFFIDKSLFHSALVIHVNLSVLVWLLSITCCVWSITKYNSGYEKLYIILGFIGMLLMSFSTFYPESTVVMNNYVPMLENIIFVIGLSMFASGVLCFALQTIGLSIWKRNVSSYGARIIRIVQFSSALIFIGVWGCCYLSYIGINHLATIVPLEIDYYYEMLFWSGGHLLQFAYTQILMFSLLVLTEAWKGGKVIYTNVYEMLFMLNLALGLALFIGHIQYDVADGSFKEFFTLHMIYTGGVVPTIFILLLVFELFQARTQNTPRFIPAALLSSITLFLSGGLIGALISGINVTIPAHYHGSIVGISIAFMGLAYVICFNQQINLIIKNKDGVISHLYNKLTNQNNASSSKFAAGQIYTIAIGQLLHIIGLGMAGGYGVLRKTPGEAIPLSAKFYMGMVGGGGLIAIIGGLMFVYICAKNLYSTNNKFHSK